MKYPPQPYLVVWTNFPSTASTGHLNYTLCNTKEKAMEIFGLGYDNPSWVIDIRTGEILANK